eukprot:COSAG02_NODE_111_length_36009_cov_42.221248_21_plen_208_part_00
MHRCHEQLDVRRNRYRRIQLYPAAQRKHQLSPSASPTAPSLCCANYILYRHSYDRKHSCVRCRDGLLATTKDGCRRGGLDRACRFTDGPKVLRESDDGRIFVDVAASNACEYKCRLSPAPGPSTDLDPPSTPPAGVRKRAQTGPQPVDASTTLYTCHSHTQRFFSSNEGFDAASEQSAKSRSTSTCKLSAKGSRTDGGGGDASNPPC